MSPRVTILLIFCLFSQLPSFGWGQRGHDIVAYTAQQNLTKKAIRNIDRVLGGSSLVYWSSWMDNIRNLPEYAVTKTWHYANVDEGQTYETMQREPGGDIVTATSMVVSGLLSKNLSDSLETLYLKYLVHLIGDMHCPMHAGRLSDRGGNNYKVKWFGRETNLHSVWDTSLIEYVRKWSYSEWYDNISYLPKNEINSLQQGTYYDWFIETVNVCKEIYMSTPEGSDLSWDYMFENYPTLELQLQRAGYRLAGLLNMIYR